MLVQFYQVRARVPVTGEMTKARYVASMETIKSRYAKGEYEIVAPAELRDMTPEPHAQSFFQGWKGGYGATPFAPNIHADPNLRAGEAALVRVFLGRYVTWCVRPQRYKQMAAAVGLYKAVAASLHPQLRVAGVAT